MASTTLASAAAAPDHIPTALLLPFSPWADMDADPYGSLERLREFGPIVYSPQHHIPGFSPNGSWIVTRAKQARQILLNTKTFSSQHTTGIPEALGESFKLAPIEADPPEHMKTRAALNPLFSQIAMRALEGKVRARTEALIDSVLDRGECEFVQDFAKILPSEIFLDLMGLPHDMLPDFLAWEESIMGSADIMVRMAGLKSVADYLREEIRTRRQTPADDVLSAVANAQIEGRACTESEALGTSILLYIAGLDTVVNALCWQFRHLAENREDRELLRLQPNLIPGAVEEMLRSYSIVSMTRIVTEDVTIDGIEMRKGDVVSIPTPLSSRDDSEFENADSVDLARGSRRHLAFGFGPHICLGMHLARVELIASVDLWIKKLPNFHIKPGAEIPCRGGAVLAIERLPLAW